MEYDNFRHFYAINGDEFIGAKLAPVTYEEHYQHIKSRLSTELAEDTIAALTEILSAQPPPLQSSQE